VLAVANDRVSAERREHETDISEMIAIVSAMLYGELMWMLSGPKPVAVNTKPNTKNSAAAATNVICRVIPPLKRRCRETASCRSSEHREIDVFEIRRDD
jgi:hypothetical protein